MFKTLPKRLALVLGVLSLLVPLSIATSGSASAFAPYSVSVGTSNNVAVAGCTFQVSAYHAYNDTVTGRLIGAVKPRSFTSSLGIATVGLTCYLYGDTDSTSASSVRNGSSTSFNKQITMPFSSSFEVCVAAATYSRAGTINNMPFNCS